MYKNFCLDFGKSFLSISKLKLIWDRSHFSNTLEELKIIQIYVPSKANDGIIHHTRKMSCSDTIKQILANLIKIRRYDGYNQTFSDMFAREQIWNYIPSKANDGIIHHTKKMNCNNIFYRRIEYFFSAYKEINQIMSNWSRKIKNQKIHPINISV